MENAQILIAGLLLAVALLGGLAQWIKVPYPIVLVIGGAVFGFMPGMPDIQIDPDVVLLIFLPPLLYVAASFSNASDLRADTRVILMSSVFLVLVTAAAVAVVAHAVIPDLPWAAAFVLGAIVSPTDPLAGAQIMRQLHVPRRLVAVVEGEGLFNDATALVVYRVAVAAAVVGTFSVADAGLELVAGAIGGVAIGLLVAMVIAAIRRRLTDPNVSITVSLLTGYAAYIPAHEIHASGVLATVTAGLYMGQRFAKDLDPRTRLRGRMVWDSLDFLLNATLFVLIGLQLPAVLNGLDATEPATLVGYAALVSGVVIVTRLVWANTSPYLVRLLDRRPQQRERRVGFKPRMVAAWAGMRGAVSLAAALAIPITTDKGEPFPQRELLIFITFGVIFATLVLQGLTLPAVIRWAGVGGGEEEEDELELVTRLAATRAALVEIDALAEAEWTRGESVERMRGLYTFRERRLEGRGAPIRAGSPDYEYQSFRWQLMARRVLQAQRNEIVRMRDAGEIPNDVMNIVLRDLDLEEARLEI